jgi:hypothetical protein
MTERSAPIDQEDSHKRELKYRTFRVMLWGTAQETKVYACSTQAKAVLIGVGYSLLMTFLFCWFMPRAYIRAVVINLQGGADHTKETIEGDFDKRTLAVWNNLLNKQAMHLTLKKTELICDIQDEFELLGKEKFTEENFFFPQRTAFAG